MRVARGKVVGNTVVLEGEPLPEGTQVTVYAGDEEEWALDEQSTQELLQAAAEADKEEGITTEALFEKLRAAR